MFDDEFLINNFLDPEEKNYSQLTKKIEYFLEKLAADQNRYHPIRKRTIDFPSAKMSHGDAIPYNPSSDEYVKEQFLNIFQGTVRWHSPFSLLNIAPSPLLDVVAATTVTALYNPNALWDFTSGNVILHEKKVIKALCELVGWSYTDADGLATFGGKATLIYAIKMGLHKCDISIIDHGIRNDYYVIASDRAHYSLEDVCNFLGIGSKNLIRIETDASGQMILNKFKETVEDLLKKNKKIACIILNCGVTIDMCVDPIYQIKMTLSELFNKWGNEKIPHVHADSVAGWAWLFFKNFDRKLLEKIDSDVADKLLFMYQLVKQIAYSDSFSVDFHKTGLTPYSSTFLVAKNHGDIFALTKFGESNLKKLSQLGDFHAHYFTLENSRSSIGIVSAWVALQKLGYTGFQKYLIKMLEIGQKYKKFILDRFGNDITLVNSETLGFETLIKINFFKNKRSWAAMNQSSSEENRLYKIYCFHFKEFIYKKIFNEKQSAPLIGFVPMYQMRTKDSPLPCFLLYPMSVYTTEDDIALALQALINLKKEFESTIAFQKKIFA